MLMLLGVPVTGQQLEQQRVQNAGIVMKEIPNISGGNAQQLLDQAESVIFLRVWR